MNYESKRGSKGIIYLGIGLAEEQLEEQSV